jgi:hypothetical protein
MSAVRPTPANHAAVAYSHVRVYGPDGATLVRVIPIEALRARVVAEDRAPQLGVPAHLWSTVPAIARPRPGRPKRPVPEVRCRQCGARLERRRYGGKWEAPSVHRARRYCSRPCAVQGRMGGGHAWG